MVRPDAANTTIFVRSHLLDLFALLLPSLFAPNDSILKFVILE